LLEITQNSSRWGYEFCVGGKGGIPVQIYLKSLSCNEETDEVGADEPYVLVTAVNLASVITVAGFPVPLPAFEVTLYGPFDDVDSGETHQAPGAAQSFWNLQGADAPITDPDQVIFLVALMENDNGDPQALRGIVKGEVGGSILGSLGNPDRNVKVATLIRDIDSALGTPTGAPNFDDQVGPVQELRFTADELRLVESGQTVSKVVTCNGDGGEYVLIFDAARPPQSTWRFCHKCNALFFDGFPTKGVCSAGGSHEAAGLDFVLQHGTGGPGQADWRFCRKCNAMFFAGFPQQGICSAGGSHEAAGFNFVINHDVDGPGQNLWRFCRKCNAMFFDGFPAKGVCPAPSPSSHEAAGFNFVLPHDIPGDQPNWRFCHKCNAMFFDGFPAKGVCSAGGGHEAAGFNFVLPHDIPGDQPNWRFCHKCNAMFFDGFPAKGVCPAPGPSIHEPAGFDFRLDHL
jgi:hypothetical protein